MAYTKIKNIKTTINKAIDYITNSTKTNKGKYIYGFNVVPKTAHIEFAFTEQMAKEAKGDYKRVNANLAYHIIQSFDYRDIITPEQALEIGKKTVEKLTEGKYEYVIATHIDKTCIHNHIIFNSVSFVDFKRFNCKPYKTIAELHSISDTLCSENGLTVLKQQKNDSKSYYEWSMEKQGLSWKNTLKNIIDKNILNATSFEEFLSLMMNNDYQIKKGKYLAFKHNAQERYIRCYKLGFDYSEEQIKERIANKSKHKSFIKNNYNCIIRKELPLSIIMKLKARKKSINNIKEIANLIMTLEKEYNIKTFKDIKNQKGKSSIEYNNIRKQMLKLENEVKEKQELQRHLLIYIKYNNTYTLYTKSHNKKQYYNLYESELILFESAKTYLKDMDITKINEIKNKNENLIKILQDSYSLLQNNLKMQKEKINLIEKLEKKLKKTKEIEQDNQNKQKRRNLNL